MNEKKYAWNVYYFVYHYSKRKKTFSVVKHTKTHIGRCKSTETSRKTQFPMIIKNAFKRLHLLTHAEIGGNQHIKLCPSICCNAVRFATSFVLRNECDSLILERGVLPNICASPFFCSHHPSIEWYKCGNKRKVISEYALSLSLLLVCVRAF